jgi:hypothetical protein
MSASKRNSSFDDPEGPMVFPGSDDEAPSGSMEICGPWDEFPPEETLPFSYPEETIVPVEAENNHSSAMLPIDHNSSFSRAAIPDTVHPLSHPPQVKRRRLNGKQPFPQVVKAAEIAASTVVHTGDLTWHRSDDLEADDSAWANMSNFRLPNRVAWYPPLRTFFWNKYKDHEPFASLPAKGGIRRDAIMREHWWAKGPEAQTKIILDLLDTDCFEAETQDRLYHTLEYLAMKRGGLISTKERVRTCFITAYFKDKELLRQLSELDLEHLKPDYDLTVLTKFIKAQPLFKEAQAKTAGSMRRIFQELNVVHGSWSLEICPRTWAQKRQVVLHLHFAGEWGPTSPKDLSKIYKYFLDEDWSVQWAGRNNVPSVSQYATKRKKDFRPMHYYVQFPKQGQLSSWTNYEAFSSFQVNPRWITGYLQGQKISLADAQTEYLKAGCNIRANISNLNALDEYNQSAFIEGKMQEIEKLLMNKFTAWRPHAEVDRWLKHHEEMLTRYKLLVFCGLSNTGKTQFLKHVFGDPALVLEVNCANCQEPDIRAFHPIHHKGILLDEASIQLILNQKKLVQAGNAVVKLGQSATNCHSYSKWVWRVGFMVSSNTWMEEFEKMESEADKEWISSNCIVVNIGNEKQYL